MEVKLVIFFLCCQLCAAKFGNMTFAHENETVTRFIKNLVNDEKAKDTSRIHDVAVLRWEQGPRSLLFDEVVGEIQENNVLLMPRSLSLVVNQRLRAASFIVIISDFTVTVKTNLRFPRTFPRIKLHFILRKFCLLISNLCLIRVSSKHRQK